MTPVTRICFDVSYTRTQTGNVGITRTVRKLLAALEQAQAAAGATCVPVAFHTLGFRTAASGVGTASVRDRPAARAYQWMTGRRLRELVQLCLPLSLLKAAWSLANRMTFDSLSKNETAVAFGPGDLLVLADECWNYEAWKAAASARAQGAVAVLVLYDLIPLRQPEYCAPLFSRVFGPWLLKMASNVDAVMCISRATAQDFRAFCSESQVEQPPTTHFRLGCDFAVVDDPESIRPSLASFAGAPRPWFAAIGTIEPRKNHALLLRVFESLWARGLDLGLLVVGRPHPGCSDLVARLQAHHEQGRRMLTLLDASDAEVNLAYSRCTALLFPSLAEGFGLPLVEARARGASVIASALPALLELGDEGVQFFTPDSAEELEARILEQASTPARKVPPPRSFTWSDSAVQFLAEFHQLATPARALAPG